VHGPAVARVGIVPRVQLLRRLAAFFFLAFGLLLWSEEADARLGRDAPIVDGELVIWLSEPALLAEEESSPCAAQPAYPAGSLGGLFSRPGLIGGFAAGFLGAGIFGLLFGHGVIGELSGVPSVLGLLFQFALLVTLGWLIWGWWRADRAVGVAQLSPRELADAYRREREAVLPELGSDANRKSEPKGKKSFAGEAHSPL
jgi:predicted lipid-binding transport protein (Tim44 family)